MMLEHVAVVSWFQGSTGCGMRIHLVSLIFDAVALVSTLVMQMQAQVRVAIEYRRLSQHELC